MKSIFSGLLILITCVLVSGCAGPKVTVGGVEYDALTSEEIDKLCFLAELYLKNNVPNVISRNEANQIRRFAPVCSIKYTGDRSGRAIVRWELPKRNIEVVFDGMLLQPSAKCWVQTEEKNPEVIDFTKKGTLEQQIKLANPKKQPRIKRNKKMRQR